MTTADAPSTDLAGPAADDGGAATGARPQRWFAPVLVAIVVVAAVIRIAYALLVVADDPVGGDAYFYHHGANLLADGEGFIVPYEYLEIGARTEAADHPPLYIAYLALWSLVGLDSVEAHLVAGALLGAAAVALVGVLGRRVAGPTVGIVAAGLAAAYPNLFGWDAMLLSEPTATVGVLVVALLAYSYRADPRPIAALLLGAGTGLAALTRAELLLLSVLVVVPAVTGRSHLLVRERLRHLVLAGLACVLVIGPWVGYNLARFEHPVTLSTGLDLTLAYSNCDSVYDGALLGYWDFACAGVAFGSADLDYLSKDQSERNEVFREQALDYASDNADRLPAVVAARVGRVLGVFRPEQQIELDTLVEGRDGWVARWGMWSYWGLALMSIAGLLVLGRRRVPRYPLVAPMATVLLAAAMTFGATRYRAAAEPMLCVLAAVAVVAAAAHLRARVGRTAALEGP